MLCDTADNATGGHVKITAGSSAGTSSGDLVMQTQSASPTVGPNPGGSSGIVILSTGAGTNGVSGKILIGTGDTSAGGTTGEIKITVGDSTTASTTGGTITMKTGAGTLGSGYYNCNIFFN